MQLDVKLDMQRVREAKQNKQQMLMRLRQLDFDNSGVITVDSLLAIAHKYNMKLTPQDADSIKLFYKRQSVSGHLLQTKVDYARVMNDIAMSIDEQGKIMWVYAGPQGGQGKTQSSQQSPYRVTIQRIEDDMQQKKMTDKLLSRRNKSVRNHLAVNMNRAASSQVHSVTSYSKGNKN